MRRCCQGKQAAGSCHAFWDVGCDVGWRTPGGASRRLALLAGPTCQLGYGGAELARGEGFRKARPVVFTEERLESLADEVAGHEQETLRRRRIVDAQPLVERHAVQTRHLPIRDDKVEAAPFQRGRGGLPAVGDLNEITFRA